MVDERRDTVIVKENGRRNPIGWIIALIVVVLLVLAFFAYGGFTMFGGASSEAPTTNQGGSGGSVNVETPDTVQVQPTNGQ